LSERRSVLRDRGKIHGDSRRFKVTSPQPRNVPKEGFAPITSDRVRGEDQLLAFSGGSADDAHGPWPRKATERTFFVAGSLA